LKKYFLAILLLALVVMASGCVTNTTNQTKNYSANGVSFQYPANWTLQNATNNNITGIMVVDADFNRTNGTLGSLATIIMGPQANSADLATFKNNITSEAKSSGVNVTNATVSIAGLTANATTLTGTDNSTNQIYVQLIDFSKNNKSFIIFLEAIGSSTAVDNAKAGFDVIIKSFKVE